MPSLIQDLTSELKRTQVDAQTCALAIEVANELGLENYEGVFFKWSKELKIKDISAEQAAMIARQLLPQINKFDKKFNEQNGSLYLEGSYKGLKIVLEYAAPPTCSIELVEETIIVPAVPEHESIVKKYVTKGDCQPLMEQNNGL